MYKNSLLRMVQLFQIEWTKRWRILVGSVLLYLFVILLCMMIPLQNLSIAEDFFIIQYVIGLLLVLGIQLAGLFPELNHHFRAVQLLQLPARPIEKFLVKLSFPFIIAPAMFLLGFLTFRPVLLQAGLALKGFMIYPLYGEDIRVLIGLTIVLPVMLGALFIPGSLLFKKVHLLFSILLLFALFLLTGFISSGLNLPAYQTSTVVDGTIGGVIGAQFEGVVNFFRVKGKMAGLVWYGAIIPVMLVAGYRLFKEREV